MYDTLSCAFLCCAFFITLFDVILIFLLFLFPASANRKTFKTSVKPGWYYFGRKMVRAHLSFIAYLSPALKKKKGS